MVPLSPNIKLGRARICFNITLIVFGRKKQYAPKLWDNFHFWIKKPLSYAYPIMNPSYNCII